MNIYTGFVAASLASIGLGACTTSAPSADTGPTSSLISGRDVDYTCDGKPMQGYLASPENSDSKRPGIMIVHDWNGIDAYEKGRADQFAAMGYVAFCADIYGKGIRPKNAQESSAEAGKYYGDTALLNKRSRAALDYLMSQDTVKKSVAAIGYCFGGKATLEMARAGMPIRAAVSIHGSLATDKPMSEDVFKGSILVLHGAEDPYVPQKDVDAIAAEMKSAGAPYTFIAYPGAVHAFTVPSPDGGSAGAKYNKEADEKSWQDLKAFLAKVLK